MKFKEGDVVRLKSGSPKMTIEIVDLKSGIVRCTWFINETETNSGDFYPESLIFDNEEKR